MAEFPFFDELEAFKDKPTDELERGLGARQYGPPDSHKVRAVEYILKERKDKQQNDRIEENFNLTSQNVSATKDMVKETRNLAYGTWAIAVLYLLTLIFSIKGCGAS